MPKLLVINSFGPMASTSLSGLMEKFGFTNIPARKLGLHEYLLGITDINSGLMEGRIKEIIKAHSKHLLSGGVSVLDRNNQATKPLVDYKKVASNFNSISANNIQDLYFNCRNIYCDAVIYKNITSNRDWHIELTTDIHRYDHRALYQAYQDNFDDVRMIHLLRPFKSWINSLASQAFLHPELKNRIKFFPHLRYKDYVLYEEAVASMSGMHIDFDELFNTPIDKLSANIADFLGVELPSCDLTNETLDLYGKATSFKAAFTKFDDNITFLKPSTLDYFEQLVENRKIGKMPHNIFAWLRYLMDMFSYRLKHKH